MKISRLHVCNRFTPASDELLLSFSLAFCSEGLATKHERCHFISAMLAIHGYRYTTPSHWEYVDFLSIKHNSAAIIFMTAQSLWE